MLVFLLLNVVDVSIYIYKRMQVEKAAQMGAQAAFNTCDETMVPATTKCPDLNSAINAAISSTSLGADVTLKSGSPAEAYYCINDSGELQYVSSVSRKPDDCSAAGMASCSRPITSASMSSTITSRFLRISRWRACLARRSYEMP